MRLVHDEARSWLARTDERFDVIQVSLIDTFAARRSPGLSPWLWGINGATSVCASLAGAAVFIAL